MAEAQAACDRLRNGLRELDRAIAPGGGGYSHELARALVDSRQRFFGALDDDLGTPAAFAALFDLVRAANAAGAGQEPAGADQLREARRELVELLDVFGLAGLAEGGAPAIPAEVMDLLEARESARRERDFAQADELRASIGALGWEVRDGPEGPQVYSR